MLRWLDYMTFADGTIPHFNDSTDGIAPTTSELKEYAERLSISNKHSPSNICSQNYQKYKSNQYEIFVDIGDIGADYIPGHAHSDNLHFVLHYQGKPLFVDKLSSDTRTKARFHFHPDIKIDKADNTLLRNCACIIFENSTSIELEEYQFAQGFNKTQKAWVAIIHFSQNLRTIIQLK